MTSASRVILGLLLLSTSACQGDEPSPRSSPEPTQAPSPIETTSLEDIEVSVNGVAIQGICSGEDTGEPAVILHHGNGGNQHHLDGVRAHLEERTRVCSYDRPGAGLSDPPADLPRPVSDVVKEMADFLQATAIEPPYFHVGVSTGGVIAFMHAQAYPDEVAGFVVINPGPPPYTADIEAAKKVLTKEEVRTAELPFYLGENPEEITFKDTDSMLTEPLPPSMPYHVLFDEDCGGDTEFCDRILTFLPDIMESLAEMGKGGEFTWVKGAGHDIHVTQPTVVYDAIDAVWERAT